MASSFINPLKCSAAKKALTPAVVVAAVEDAIALATRKYYKTTENMRAELDPETGELRAYVYKTVVESCLSRSTDESQSS